MAQGGEFRQIFYDFTSALDSIDLNIINLESALFNSEGDISKADHHIKADVITKRALLVLANSNGCFIG